MPSQYAPELRRRVIDLIESGRSVAEVASMVEPTEATIYAWNADTAPSECSHPSNTRPATPKPHDQSQQTLRDETGEHHRVHKTGSTPAQHSAFRVLDEVLPRQRVRASGRPDL